MDDSLEKFCAYKAYNEACKAAIEIIMGLLLKHLGFLFSPTWLCQNFEFDKKLSFRA